MDIQSAKKLIVAFALNQANITKRANTAKGLSNKLLNEEKNLVGNLLDNLVDADVKPYPQSDVTDIINSIS